MKYYNLGSGITKRKSPEYINVDIREHKFVDIVADIRHLPIESESVDGVMSDYAIEHLPRADIEITLLEWVRIIKKGGWLEITTVDLGELMNNWQGIPYENMLDGIYGAQKYDEDLHKCGFTEQRLVEMFECCELTDIKVKKFEHRKIPRITIKGIKI